MMFYITVVKSLTLRFYSWVEKWSSRRPHESENVGSNPAPATKKGLVIPPLAGKMKLNQQQCGSTWVVS